MDRLPLTRLFKYGIVLQSCWITYLTHSCFCSEQISHILVPTVWTHKRFPKQTSDSKRFLWFRATIVQTTPSRNGACGKVEEKLWLFSIPRPDSSFHFGRISHILVSMWLKSLFAVEFAVLSTCVAAAAHACEKIAPWRSSTRTLPSKKLPSKSCVLV